MSYFRETERIKAEIIETESILEMVTDHPLMSESFKQKLRNLKSQLQELSKEAFEPKISLLFSGDAVKGSIGIKSSFVSQAIKPFQEMIKTQVALVRFGNVAKRGRTKKGIYSELYLTALPCGSFGIELSQLDGDDLFDQNEVAKAMKQVMQLIKDASDDDEKFESAIENMPSRNLSNLSKFLKEIADEKSILKMESGDLGIEIDEPKILEAYDRVAAAITEDEPLFILGILRGFLLDSGKFEMQDEEGKKKSGFISEDLSEDQIIEYDRLYLNRKCQFHLIKHKTKFKTGHEKIFHELLEINEVTE